MPIVALRELADYLTEQLRAELAAQDHNATGALADSVRVDVTAEEGGYMLTAYANDYGVYVNNGRRAGSRFVPTDVILAWMERRGIGMDLTKEYQRRGLAYVISRSIAQRGIPPQGGYSSHYPQGNSLKRTGWVSDTIERLKPEIDRKVEEALGTIVTKLYNDLTKVWQQQ
jgi:hypothetical protein